MLSLVQIVVMAGGANDFVLDEPMPLDEYLAAALSFIEEVLLGLLLHL